MTCAVLFDFRSAKAQHLVRLHDRAPGGHLDAPRFGRDRSMTRQRVGLIEPDELYAKRMGLHLLRATSAHRGGGDAA